MAEEKIQVEFTDRYDGNAPSWLRGCFDCQAMGVYPVKAHLRDDHVPGKIDSEPEELGKWERAEVERWIAAGERQADGWYFIKCQHCNGRARISWLRTMARIPRWLWKGIRFTFIDAPRCSSHMPYRSAAWLGFKCAFLVDLKLWRSQL